MKMKYIIMILFVLLFGGCAENKRQTLTPALSPFKPVLELAITELIDSLKNEIGENQLLSIEFHLPDFSYHDRRGNGMSMYILDGYASANIDGYAKIDSTTIAIYNLKDDFFELVNKNDITFFTDTIVGFKDICYLDLTKKNSSFTKSLRKTALQEFHIPWIFHP